MPASFAIGKHFERFIQDLVRKGRYNSKSEVIREGLRLLQDREQDRTIKMEELRRAFREGLNSGPGIASDEAFARLKKKYELPRTVEVKPVVFTPKALNDLDEIAGYIAADNPERALTFIADIEKRCAAIGRRPGATRSFPALAPDAHIVPFRNYLIIYCDRPAHVLIARVIHGARDILALLDADN